MPVSVLAKEAVTSSRIPTCPREKKRDDFIRKRDSGVLSDMDYAKFNSMSSTESEKRGSCSSLNYSFSESVQSIGSRYDYSTGGSSRSAGTTGSGRFQMPATVPEQDRRPAATLPELSQVPWTEADILSMLQNSKAKGFCENLSVECLQRFAYLLQRPLIRIAREAQRLSKPLNKCTKHELQTACKIILSPSVYEQCNKCSTQAVVLYAMGHKDMHISRSSRCGLSLSTGKHHRWLVEANVAEFVHELASVYLTGCIESLVEQTVFFALSKEDLVKPVITTDMLEKGIQLSTDLHSIYHCQSHLASGRDASDSPRLPQLNILHTSQRQRLNQSLYKTIECNLLSTCVSSLNELGDIINQAMQYWYNKGTSTVSWSAEALKSLFYFMKCSDADCCHPYSPLISIKAERSIECSPTLMEWLRVAIAFTEHRHNCIIDSNDVLQAARVLLPSANCPIRSYRHEKNHPMSQDFNLCMESYQQDLAFTMLLSGKCELVPHAKILLGKSGLDHINAEGLTPLMISSMSGDEAMVQALVETGASMDISVPATSATHPLANPACHGWTALCFAVMNHQINIAKLLVDSGCCVEGGATMVGDNSFDTPLQLAAATGQMELLMLLLNKSADPYQNTMLMGGGFSSNATCNTFTLTASHGHRDILQRLFKHPINTKASTMLSLSDILAETPTENQVTSKMNMCNKLKNSAEEAENEYMVIENDYVTIEELREQDVKMHQLGKKLAYCQMETLQNALYSSTEHGYLDIALEIHSMGLPWTPYTWFMTLNTAQILQRKAILQSLLREFSSLHFESHTKLLSQDCLPLMFDIFRESKNEIISQQLAGIFSSLFGKQPVPLLKDIRCHPSSVIDSSYVNSPQLSDICFIVEEKVFYAHKIILVNASNRFKTILANFSDCASPEIEINDITYSTFEMMMQYLYSGVGHVQVDGSNTKVVKNLLGAAHYFQLDGLKRKCEIILSKNLTIENCISSYKTGKIYACDDLMEFCEAFFLQNLSQLLGGSDSFKKVLFSGKAHNKELLERLSMALSSRLNMRSRSTQNALRKTVSSMH